MKYKREANLEFLRRRKKQLFNRTDILKWLRKQGLSEETINIFALGVSGSYFDSKNILHKSALLAPIQNESGLFINQTVYINIPDITINPLNESAWVRGNAKTYYSEKYDHQAFVMICEDLWDLWLTFQHLHKARYGSNLLLICPTPNPVGIIPAEWRDPKYWERFENIYLGLNNSATAERKAVKLSQIIGRDTQRFRPPLKFGESWAEFWSNRGTVKEFFSILSDTDGISLPISSEDFDSNNYSLGRFGYEPVNIASSLHRGHLYYPVITLVNSLDSVGRSNNDKEVQITSHMETVVVRSDRKIFKAREDPAPRGTPPENRILRLTDGTIISEKPKATVYSTWSWQSIEAYCQKRSKPRHIKTILREVKSFLRRMVWLPYAYDYDLLTLLVPITFAQAVFQAVPIILVTGEPGSGKSALGSAMCRVCANAVPVGQISAAAVARLIHETKGFVLLDDLESIGKRSNTNSAQFSELIQALKLSYNKDTSWKLWTDVRRGMSVEKLNFFGVKMINNTTGADAILGSRMLKVFTRKMSDELLSSRNKTEYFENQPNTDSLRDELHTWTFENVTLIDATYKRLFPKPSDRHTEIAAPLRVFAEIAGEEELSKGLETALSVKSEAVEKPADPIDLMMRAVKNIVRAGYRQISTTHVTLEMKLINSQQALDHHEPYRFKPEKWESPSWVGRSLRTYGFIDINAEGKREWLFGKSLRIYPVNEEFLKKVSDENETYYKHLEKKPTDFCNGCISCVFRELNCPIMSTRTKAEN